MLKVTLDGNLFQDAEMRGEGSAARCVIKLGHSIRSRGDEPERTIVVWAKVWGRRGESLCRHLRKGTRVVIVGSCEPRTHEYRGEHSVQLDVDVDEIVFMSRAGDGASDSAPEQPRQQPRQQVRQQPRQQVPVIEEPPF